MQVQKISETFPKIGTGSVLSNSNPDTGIFISQNPITK
jgi:hypothetical protein